MSWWRNEWLIRLFPARWKARYGEEFLELLNSERVSVWTILDVAKIACTEQLKSLINPGKMAMQSYPKTLMTLALKPSALTPLVMSALALAVVVATLLISGTKSRPDEGAAAHLFQLLVVAQVPIMAFFVLRWSRTGVRASLSIALIQVLAIVIASLPVWYFHL